MPIKKEPIGPKTEIAIGSYPLGFMAVSLIIREGTGGEFRSNAKNKTHPTIRVGAYGPDQWDQCLVTLLHETTEAAMFWDGLRYSPDNRVCSFSHADYLFVMTHEQFHACIAKVGDFLRHAVPALQSEFTKWHAKPKKAKRRK